MKKRKIDIDIHDFPTGLHPYLQSGEIYDSSSSPEAQTLYCTRGFYIKIAPVGALAEEARLCKRFYSMGLGVEVMHYISEDRDYFVTRSALGEDLTHFLDNPKLLCEVLADALQTLHSQSADNIPVSSQFRSFLELTNRDFDRVSYDDSMQIGRFRIESKEQAWEIIQNNKDKLKPTTLIHGDACLPNILCHEGSFNTFIDLGQAGAGDRHMDLYWAIWSLEYNLKTDHYTDYFLDQYGRKNIDFELLKVITAFETFS